MRAEDRARIRVVGVHTSRKSRGRELGDLPLIRWKSAHLKARPPRVETPGLVDCFCTAKDFGPGASQPDATSAPALACTRTGGLGGYGEVEGLVTQLGTHADVYTQGWTLSFTTIHNFIRLRNRVFLFIAFDILKLVPYMYISTCAPVRRL